MKCSLIFKVLCVGLLFGLISCNKRHYLVLYVKHVPAIHDSEWRKPCDVIQQCDYNSNTSQVRIYYQDGRAKSYNVVLPKESLMCISDFITRNNVMSIHSGNWFSGESQFDRSNIYINVMSTNYTRVHPHEARTTVCFGRGSQTISIVVLNYPHDKVYHDAVSSKIIDLLDMIDQKLKDQGVELFPI